MAKENIARFIEAMVIDKPLAEKVTALAAEHGYNFTVEELLASGNTADSVQSLSDTEVEMVSGGRVAFPIK